MRYAHIKQRTLVAVIAAALSVSAGSAAFAQGKSHGKDKQSEAEAAAQPQAAQGKGHGKGGEKAAKGERGQEDAARNAQQATYSRQDEKHHGENAQRQQAQAMRVDELHRDIANRQADKRASQDAKHAAKRLAKAEQQQMITRQQAQVLEYRRTLDAQRSTSQRIATALEQQNRMQQAQYVQQYNQRLWQQQQQYRSSSFDYNNDPYFYSAPTYSYNMAGRNYQTNQYGADLLRAAINNGYREGLRAGRADQMDNWSRPDYRNSYAYQQPYYGYDGYHLDADQYAYYFRQGVQRGYDDGYYNRSQYRSGTNATSIVTSLLSSILNLRSY